MGSNYHPGNRSERHRPGAGTGGASNCAAQNSDYSACVSGFPQPIWQTVTVSGQTTRMVPDVVFLATPNFPGYIFCTQLSELGESGGSSCEGGIVSAISDGSLIGGTSVSAPIFAGVVTLLNQYTASTGQGNINYSLYSLAATAPSAFHDITAGDNHIACEGGTPSGQPSPIPCPGTAGTTGTIGYSAGTGFDMATGLGSLDVNNLAVALKNPPNFTASTPTTTLSVFGGQSGTATITVTPINNFSAPVGFSCSGPTGVTCSFSPTTVTPTGGEPANTTATIQTGASAANGNVTITATTGVSSQLSNPAGSIALTVTPGFSLAPTAASFQVAQGASANATITVTPATGFTGTLSFTCNDTAPLSLCPAPPNIVFTTQNNNTPQTVSFAISTTAPTTALRGPAGRSSSSGMFYAALLPGLLGILFTAGSRRRSLRGMHLLGLIAMLGFSTLWIASCGGSNSGGTSNPGTPVGNYTITVSATSGGATIAAPTFQLDVVQ